MIELKSVIQELRSTLEEAIVEAAGEKLQFELGAIELEVGVTLERSHGGEAKVKFWVVDLGGTLSSDATEIQRVKLTLTPRLNGQATSILVNAQGLPGES